MKNRIEKPPILITGAARSGTSMVAGCINICGTFGGDLLGASKHNAKGFFENAHIRDQIEKVYLRKHDLDPLGQYPVAETKGLSIPQNWRHEIESTMIRQGYDLGPWFYKGAKACQIWPVWNYAFPNAKWIIVRRRSVDIAESCLRTGFMKYYKDFDGWMKWVRYHEEKFNEMIDAGLNVKLVWPDRLVRGDYSQLLDAIEWLGLPWRSEKVMSFIEPKLWKAKQKAGIRQ